MAGEPGVTRSRGRAGAGREGFLLSPDVCIEVPRPRGV
jgi:hypothetical protein